MVDKPSDIKGNPLARRLAMEAENKKAEKVSQEKESQASDSKKSKSKED